MRKFILLMVLCFASSVGAAEEKFQYDAKGKRDPFWKLVTNSGVIVNYDTDLAIADLTLEGIIFDPQGNSLAIINGKIVKVNDQVASFLVVKVEKDRVVLVKGAEMFVLELKKGE